MTAEITMTKYRKGKNFWAVQTSAATKLVRSTARRYTSETGLNQAIANPKCKWTEWQKAPIAPPPLADPRPGFVEYGGELPDQLDLVDAIERSH